tara:strand:- start:799 stop:1920 length:1122 start_codon:yes stop_codon:yes gene_type:complete
MTTKELIQNKLNNIKIDDIIKNKIILINDIKRDVEKQYTINSELDKSIDYQINYIFDTLLIDIKKRELLKEKVHKLQQLKLPEQRTTEWYELRKKVLTASSLASALGKDHFKSKYELIESKLIERPFEFNEITEHGVKYEEIATQYYEYLNNVKILEFGLIPHPEFPIFGASPDGICSNDSPNEYIGRMLEIKCPPKRKFTKSVPEHYKYQILGQLECCDLEECDFFQVKISEYNEYSDYLNDINDKIGYTNNNFPKGCIITYKKTDKDLGYLYPGLFKTNDELNEWIENKKKWLKENNFTFEKVNWWKIERYECTLVKRDKQLWSTIIDDIILFYNELEYYKHNISELHNIVSKKTNIIKINDILTNSDCLL